MSVSAICACGCVCPPVRQTTWIWCFYGRHAEVFLYLCGGRTIPILSDWLTAEMCIGAATAFMVTGPATKLTNSEAVKIVLGTTHFAYYILFSVAAALLFGVLVNLWT